MRIIHTIPLFIHDRHSTEFAHNMTLLKNCFQSLAQSKENMTVIYNQGCLPNEELAEVLSSLGMTPIILGNGINSGIAMARQHCFQYIWEHFPETDYISEIHLDMIFPVDWYSPLLDFLDQSDEPIISPGILTSNGELQPTGSFTKIPENVEEMTKLLKSLSRNEILEGFVHPVVHKSEVLKQIGGYDTHFLKGKQGYEDDSLLLGYLYYMGLKTNWRPKCCLKSWVYHATMAQRMSLHDKHLDFQLNEHGLIKQYGAYGLKHLSVLHQHSSAFAQLFQEERKR